MLVEQIAVGRGEDHFVVVALGFEGCYAAIHRLHLHYHAGLAAEGVVVDLAVLVGGVVAKVVDMKLGQPLGLRPFQDGAVER